MLNLDFNTEERYDGRTPLHYAVELGHSKMVDMFVQKSAELNIDINIKSPKQ